MARAFCAVRAKHKEDFGVTINPIDHPQAWGAWSSYFKTKRMSAAYFRQRGQQLAEMSNLEQRAEKGFQVPALLPSDFDEDQDFISDKLAGDNFMAAQERKRKQVAEMKAMTQQQRAEHVQRALQRMYRTMNQLRED